MRAKRTATKAELVERLAVKMNTDPQTAELAYESMVEILAENIAAGKGTSFRGVGIVTAEHKPSKTVRVPTLANPATIPARIVCNFDMVRRFSHSLYEPGLFGSPELSQSAPG